MIHTLILFWIEKEEDAESRASRTAGKAAQVIRNKIRNSRQIRRPSCQRCQKNHGTTYCHPIKSRSAWHLCHPVDRLVHHIVLKAPQWFINTGTTRKQNQRLFKHGWSLGGNPHHHILKNRTPPKYETRQVSSWSYSLLPCSGILVDERCSGNSRQTKESGHGILHPPACK